MRLSAIRHTTEKGQQPEEKKLNSNVLKRDQNAPNFFKIQNNKQTNKTTNAFWLGNAKYAQNFTESTFLKQQRDSPLTTDDRIDINWLSLRLVGKCWDGIIPQLLEILAEEFGGETTRPRVLPLLLSSIWLWSLIHQHWTLLLLSLWFCSLMFSGT